MGVTALQIHTYVHVRDIHNWLPWQLHIILQGQGLGVVTTAYAYIQPPATKITKYFSFKSRGHVHFTRDGHESHSLAKWVGLGV